jgi:glycerol-3-phosphate dehydrogenase
LPEGTPQAHRAALAARHPGLPAELIATLVARHGARAADILRGVSVLSDLGTAFGANLYAREIDHFVSDEWARSAEDVLWRRTKAGLHLTPEQRDHVATYVRSVAGGP